MPRIEPRPLICSECPQLPLAVVNDCGWNALGEDSGSPWLLLTKPKPARETGPGLVCVFLPGKEGTTSELQVSPAWALLWLVLCRLAELLNTAELPGRQRCTVN